MSPDINSVDDYFNNLDDFKLVNYWENDALKRAADRAGLSIDQYCIAAIEGTIKQYCQLSTFLTAYQTKQIFRMYGKHCYENGYFQANEDDWYPDA